MHPLHRPAVHIVLLLAVTAAPALARTAVAGQTYSNTDYGFQVTAPAGWTITQNVGSALVLLESPDGQSNFRAYGKLLAGLTSPSEHRRVSKSQYGIRGRETTVQALIESWEGREPVYLPMPSGTAPVEVQPGPLEGEALHEGTRPVVAEPSEASYATGKTTTAAALPEPSEASYAPGKTDEDYNPDAGEAVVENLTIMQALVMLQGTTGAPYADAETRRRRLELEKDKPAETTDPLASVLAELALGPPFLAVYEQELGDPVTGEVRRTTQLACFVLRNMVGYTFVASMPTERFESSLWDMTGIFQSLQIPTLEGGSFSSSGALNMDPQTTGVIVGKVLIRGTPVPGASVLLYRTEEDYRAGRVYKTCTSNFIGEFQLIGVPPGTYFLLEATADLGGEILYTYLPVTQIKVQRGFGSFYNLELDQAQ
ncbi:MAG: carboxypeptidase-like regulatory domain-containing protein [bacterium]|nr:carboxypeptidase-like regulatory domain-containing protein [bacterium]